MQLATNEIAAIFTLRSVTAIDSLPPMSQAIHEYINKANGMRSHIITLMMETESVSENQHILITLHGCQQEKTILSFVAAETTRLTG
jgi:hypothetical protein